ncbi:MAG TPA: hypothetical protein VMV54_08755 [Acidocella sp.]|nr:hypothetical protein [Acidocella sp.]
MLKFVLRRVRRVMQAEVMAELTSLRAEMARRDEIAPLVRQMEAALLTIALGSAGADENKSRSQPSGPAAADSQQLKEIKAPVFP